MRVLVSAGWLGGAGGAERALFSVLRALSEDEVEVVVREHLDGPLAEIGSRVRVHSMMGWRFRAASMHSGAKGKVVQRLLNPLRRRLTQRYDVYLQFHAGPNVGGAVNAAGRLLVPSGNQIDADRAKGFDYVALQAPDNAGLVAEGIRTVLLPPPLYELSPASEPPGIELPEKYYLTVFNPYGPVKGTEDLAKVIDKAPHPIVWCHSQQTVRFDIPEPLLGHTNLIHVVDAEPSQLRYLYENCLAYLSFSRSEGFGWSTADALRYSPSVVSRKIGILSYRTPLEGVVIVDGHWDVDWSSLPDEVAGVRRDLGCLDPARFRARLLEVSWGSPSPRESSAARSGTDGETASSTSPTITKHSTVSSPPKRGGCHRASHVTTGPGDC